MADTMPEKTIRLEQLLACAQLPALPQSAIRVLELSKDPENGPAEFAVPIEADPGLTGQVLRFVNSSYFGFSREISNVKLAITMVGVRTIKNFALWSAVFSIMPNPKCGPFELKSLWQDSLRRGLFARNVSRLLGVREVEEPFAAALLQDMAIPVLAKELSSDYDALLEARQRGRVRLSVLERQRFGWSHADAGAQLVERWNLPQGFAELVGRHTSIEELLGDDAAPREQLAVALSSLLPATGDDAWHECQQFEACCQALPAGEPASVVELLEKTDGDFREFAPILKLSESGKTLVQRYHDAVQPAG